MVGYGLRIGVWDTQNGGRPQHPDIFGMASNLLCMVEYGPADLHAWQYYPPAIFQASIPHEGQRTYHAKFPYQLCKS